MMRRIISVFLLPALVLCLTACKDDAENAAHPSSALDATPPATTAPPGPDYAAMYNRGRKKIDQASNLTVTVEIEQQVTVEDRTWDFSHFQDVTLRGLDGENFQASLTDIFSQDGSKYTMYQAYSGGSMYVTSYSGGLYQGEISQEEYLSSQVPSVLLDSALYSSISAEEENGMTTLSFTQPAAAESWALPEGAEFIQASGTALISRNGNLKRTQYTIEYRHGKMHMLMDVTASTAVRDEVAKPNIHTYDMYTQVSSILEIVPYELSSIISYENMKNHAFSADITKVLTFGHLDAVMTVEEEIHKFGSEDELVGKISHIRQTATDNIAVAEKYVITYRDGIAVISHIDGNTESTPIEADLFIADCAGRTDAGLIPPKYLSDISVQRINGQRIYTITPNEKALGSILQYISILYFDFPNFLGFYIENPTVSVNTITLTLDDTTGLLLSCSSELELTCIFDGEETTISFITDKNFDPLGTDAYQEATKDEPPIVNPGGSVVPMSNM